MRHLVSLSLALVWVGCATTTAVQKPLSEEATAVPDPAVDKAIQDSPESEPPDPAEDEAEPDPPAKVVTPLEAAIARSLEQNGHWTTIAPAGVAHRDRAVAMMLSFNNEKMPPQAWSPEVAVQYVFDGAVQPVAKAVFEDAEKRFAGVTILAIDVRIHPYDPPSQLLFELPLDLWRTYRDGRSPGAKVELYRQMVIMCEDERYRFDPVKAADVE